MPNFFAAFQSEVFKPLVTILLPGGLAISSWFVLVLLRYAYLKQLVFANHTETIFTVLLLMLLFGLIIDSLGTHCEWLFDRYAGSKSGGQHTAEWYAYLRTAFIADPIGRRYIRSVVLKLKFEFGVAIGLLLAVPGLILLRIQQQQWGATAYLLPVATLSALLLLFEAFSTHTLLARTRTEMLKPIRIIQATPAGESTSSLPTISSADESAEEE